MAAPFLKWAGGKRGLLSKYEEFFPQTFKTYHEPFLGGGAVFFHLASQGRITKAVLSDLNEELITTYQVVRQEPEALLAVLEDMAAERTRNPKEHFYTMRREKYTHPVNIAARLIYLNRTCFNGLYRVNGKGGFNVPYGNYSNPKIVDRENIMAVSEALHGVELECASFSNVTTMKYRLGLDDFVYLDPPYDGMFGDYQAQKFSGKNQIILAGICKLLDMNGVKFMQSNADTENIRTLYRDFEIIPITKRHNIAASATSRKDVGEVIIRNY